MKIKEQVLTCANLLNLEVVETKNFYYLTEDGWSLCKWENLSNLLRYLHNLLKEEVKKLGYEVWTDKDTHKNYILKYGLYCIDNTCLTDLFVEFFEKYNK